MAPERELRDRVEKLQAELARATRHAACEELANQLRDQRDALVQEITRYQIEAKARRQQVTWLRDELAAVELERRKLEAQLYGKGKTQAEAEASAVEEFFFHPIKR